MDLKQIYEFRLIDGVSKGPGVAQDGLFPQWDNTLGVFLYSDPLSIIGYNTDTTDGIVTRGDSASGTGYIWKGNSSKVPGWRKENYLSSSTWNPTTFELTLVMNDSSNIVTDLSSLEPFTLTLPGYTKVLFDDGDTIGGSDKMTFNDTNGYLNFTDLTAIQMQNGSDANLKGVLQYFGGSNIALAHGTTKTLSSASNMSGNLFIGNLAGDNLFGGTNQDNVIIGTEAGKDVATTLSGCVIIGPYAGRLETADNKFYVGNTSETSLSDYQNNSLLYGDFSTGWLRINNRLEVSEEVRFGTFDTGNTPYWGMVQFIIDGSNYKPQYYNGTAWIDFANSTDNYLNEVRQGTAMAANPLYLLEFDVGTTADPTSIDTFEIQLGANAFNSTIIGNAGSIAGAILISTGVVTDSNAGFSSISGLTFTDGILYIDNTIRFEETTFIDTTTIGGEVIYVDGHFWGYSDTELQWNQLDSVCAECCGGAWLAENIGGEAEVYVDASANPAYFRTLVSTDGFIGIVQTATQVEFCLDYVADGSNVGGGVGEFYHSTTRTSNGDTLNFKTLTSADASITIVNGATTVDLSSSVAAINNTGSNLGAGEGWYLSNSGSVLQFKSAIEGNHIRLTSSGTEVEIAVDPGVLTDLTGSTVGSSTSSDLYMLVQDGTDGMDFTQKFINAGSNITITEIEDGSSNVVGYSIAATSGVAGETNTMLNLGTGEGVYYQKTGVQFEMKSLTEGEHVTLTASTSEIEVAVEDIVLDDQYTGTSTPFYILSDGTNSFEPKQYALIAGTGMTITLTDGGLTLDATGVGGGEVNVGTNLGDEAELYVDKLGAALRFRTIGPLEASLPSGYSYTNIAVIEDTNEIQIAAKDETPLTLTDLGASGGIYLLDDPSDHTITQKEIVNAVDSILTIVDTGTTIEFGLIGGIGCTGENKVSGTGYVELFDETNSTTTLHKFRTITGSGNLTVTQETNYLNFNVADIVITNLGSGEASISNSGFAVAQKTFVSTNGIEITSDSDEITIDNTIEIGQFNLIGANFDYDINFTSGTPTFTSGAQGTIEFRVAHDDDVRDGSPTYVDRVIGEINIGAGLLYDSINNTLSSTAGAGQSQDYVLTSVSGDSGSQTVTFTMTDVIGSGAPTTVDVNFGAMAFVESVTHPIAQYTTASGGSNEYGGVIVEKTGITRNSVAFETALTLNETTGELKNTLDSVNYIEVYVDKTTDAYARTFARTNVNAAFINGDLSEDFNGEMLNFPGIGTPILNSDAGTVLTYFNQIGDLRMSAGSISSNYGTDLTLIKKQSSQDYGCRIEQDEEQIDITVDITSGIGEVNIYGADDNTSERVHLFRLDVDGNLYIKGNIVSYAEGSENYLQNLSY